MMITLYIFAFITLGVDILAQDYIGCFRNSEKEPDLPILATNRASSPTECAKECKSKYYM